LKRINNGQRDIGKIPKINKEIKTVEDIENLCYDDFKLINYQHHPAIKYEMAI
jgi:thymidylate synthase